MVKKIGVMEQTSCQLEEEARWALDRPGEVAGLKDLEKENTLLKRLLAGDCSYAKQGFNAI